MQNLAQKIGQLTYKSPFVIGSSPLTDRIELIKQAEDYGAGAISTKLTMLEQPHAGLRKMYCERGYYNFNPSDKRNNFEEGLELVRKAREETDLIIWANMAGPGDQIDGWIKLGKALEEAGAHLLELNFTCPNRGTSPNGMKVGASVGKDPVLCREIAAAVKNAVHIPVYPKITAECADILAIYKAIESAKADGIVINAGYTGAPPIDIYRRGAIKMAGLTKCSYGGTVGRLNKPYSNRLVGLCAQNTNLTIAGGGGISTWEDAVESMMFGATLTTICSKIIVEGFGYLEKLNAGLSRFMEENGYASLCEMRGLALENICQTSELHQYKITAPPKFNMDRCVGCGSCEKIGCCNAIKMQDDKPHLQEDLCQFCGLCAAICTKGAIYF